MTRTMVIKIDGNEALRKRLSEYERIPKINDVIYVSGGPYLLVFDVVTTWHFGAKDDELVEVYTEVDLDKKAGNGGSEKG